MRNQEGLLQPGRQGSGAQWTQACRNGLPTTAPTAALPLVVVVATPLRVFPQGVPGVPEPLERCLSSQATGAQVSFRGGCDREPLPLDCQAGGSGFDSNLQEL